MTRKVKSFFFVWCNTVYCTTPHGTMYDARWYKVWSRMAQCLTSQSLWDTSPKSLAYLSKDFRTPMFIPRSANICAMENHGLYHSRPTKVCTLSDKNHVVYDPKLPYLHPETMALLMPKPHGLGCQTLQVFSNAKLVMNI